MKLSNRPIFLTARFRTGSTMLWHFLRQCTHLRAYYEPCHDNLIEHVLGDTPPQASHTAVTSYWDEYRPLMDQLPTRHQHDFGVSRLYLDASDEWPELASYLQFLLARSAPARPLLQFNRMDFRLPWLRAKFPDAFVVHLFRNPREQWLSMTRNVPDDRLADPDENSDYDLVVWAVALSSAFPFLVGPHLCHSYERHYLIWKLSHLVGCRYADLSMSYDHDFVSAPERGVRTLFDAVGVAASAVGELPSSIRAPSRSVRTGAPSLREFEAMEASCDRLLLQLGLTDRLGATSLSDIRHDYGAAWAPFTREVHEAVLRLSGVTYSRLRSRYLEAVTALRQLGQNARNVQNQLATKERLLRECAGDPQGTTRATGRRVTGV